MDANDANASEGGPRPRSPDSAFEPLACVACRARKLKCDRMKPECSRCRRAADGPMCLYPESRRKPMFKRRNVKDLEVRLAQVEGLLRHSPGTDRKRNASDHVSDTTTASHGRNSGQDGSGLFSIITAVDDSDSDSDPGSYSGEGDPSSELVDLGMSETSPPSEIIDALHTAYFKNQHMFIPIVHRARYLRAYHSPPHMRPPMGLQYAIWAMAAQVHPKYSGFHDAFYRRARQYLENDEMKGHGEHFITIGHAQAWALTAAYEARRLFFTRAAMSCSRSVRLVGMMGLGRLDDDAEGDRTAATLFPPADWVELEERRRVYWGAFCVDSHASISTGWPTVINASEATTHLPSSEEAFNEGREQASCTLENVFSGSTYSTFSSAIVVCYVFNSILRHVQVKPGDRPEDFDNGPFWQRHRNLDTKLTSAFVFLPEKYRLPNNFSNPVAVHTNLNLHAATICLHNAALERAEAHGMPASVIQYHRDRLLTAAHEIVNIVKRTSHMTGSYKSPLASLSLYCATSVFVYHAIQNERNGTQDTADAEAIAANIEFIMRCMDNGRSNNVTRLLLHQAILDIDRNGLAPAKHFHWFKKYSQRAVETGNFVPVLARSSVSRHSWMQPPMADRLPLISNHNRNVMKTQHCCTVGSTKMCKLCRKKMTEGSASGATTGPGNGVVQDGDSTNKRRRMQSPGVEPSPATSGQSLTSLTSSASLASLASSADSNSLDTVEFPRFGAAFAVLADRTASPSTPADAYAGESSAASRIPTSIQDSDAMSMAMASMPPPFRPGMAFAGGEAYSPSQQSTTANTLSHIQIFDPWTGPSSSLGTAFPDAQAYLAGTGVPSTNLDTGAAQQIQLDPGLQLDQFLLYPDLANVMQPSNSGSGEITIAAPVSVDDIVPGDDSAHEADAWTTFLQAEDFDSSAGWNAAGENPEQ